MDILQACEDLANNIAAFDPFDSSEDNVPKEQTQRLQDLFGFTEEEAIKELNDWRADFGRTSIPLLAWQEISQEKKSMGFDKESYEYSLSPRWLSRQAKPQKTDASPFSSASEVQAETTYLVKLEGSIPNVTSLQQLAGLSTPPHVKVGEGDTTELFGVIDGHGRAKLLASLPKGSQTTIISISRARKNLSRGSMYPSLGLETTLPQYRLSSPPTHIPQASQPANEECPVWYFFYGTLANEERLSRLLGPDHPVSLTPAWTTGGRLGTWAGTYKALVDDFGGGRVHGHGFLLQDQQAEDALRYYETGVYEVVRCDIHLETPHRGVNMVKGLTFRHIGDNLEED